MRRPDIAVVGIGIVALAATAFGQPPSDGMPDAAAGPAADLPDTTRGGELTPDQMAAYDSWPEDQRAIYDAWPLDTQAYFWTLPPDRQALFWRLTDDGRVRLSAMSEPDREATWKMLEERAAGEEPGAPPETEGEPQS